MSPSKMAASEYIELATSGQSTVNRKAGCEFDNFVDGLLFFAMFHWPKL